MVDLVENKATDTTFALGIFGTNLDIIVSTRDDGPCQIQLANTGSSLPVSAGTLTVSADSAATITIPFAPAEGYFAMQSGLLYGANEQLMVSAPGDTVAAFSAQLAFPAGVTVTSGAPNVLNKSGFTATWMATTSPVAINISQYPSSAPKLNITCMFDGALGTGTVPSTALTDVVMGTSVGIGISTRTDALMMADDYPADVHASYLALNKNNVTVQP